MSSKQLRPLPLPAQTPYLCSRRFCSIRYGGISKPINAPMSLQLYSTPSSKYCCKIRAITLDDIPPNAVRRKRDPQWRGGFSLGVDLGMARSGVALSKGFSIRPLTVLELRGQKFDVKLLQIAEQEEADEFIIGLPISFDGKETPQSNKVRSIAGRLAVQAAERGWRVYLQDEHGTTAQATDLMINMGLSKSARQKKNDAYAAMMVLERYFSTTGQGLELVLPKNLDLQENLRRGPPKDIDFF
ncbi:Holliday junction resolvase-like protein [Quillaja saponaria]|uniref:Holliday junction resolvase-like protein n=1 Tax=Quillaja saponaria TaxID=32244 RepID=A0AAD7LRE8_QUISA|nr:Holliday junction resolvase-like protein [Quillaja saponaria]